MVDEFSMITNLGVGAGSLYIMFQFSKYVAEKSLGQIEQTNKCLLEFMDKTYKENTKAMNEMVLLLREHVKQKDEMIELLKNDWRHNG